MELLEIEVKTRQSLTLPWQEVQVMPIGDVQLGSQGVALEKLKKTIRWALDQKNVYFIGMGDYLDVMSPSNRQSWRSAALYDSVREAMADKARDLCHEFLKVIKGTEGRWLGLLEGHHLYEFEDGTTSDTYIAQQLRCPFLGSCAFVRLTFSRQPTSETRLSATIFAHHGSGNGLTPHSPLSRLYHVMHQFEADIYLIGHQTKKPAVKVPYLSMSRAAPYKLVAKHRILAGTGGFLEGYHQGSTDYTGRRAKGGYVEQALMPPSALGAPLIKIRPARNGNEARLDMNVEI